MTERLDLLPSAAAHDERREAPRHDSPAADSVVVRVIGGSEAKLLDLSRRGLLIETESRLSIGARATVRITTRDGVVTVAGRVVRSRVAGVGASIFFQTALALEDDLLFVDTLPRRPSKRDGVRRDEAAPTPEAELAALADGVQAALFEEPAEPQLVLFESDVPFDTHAWQPETLEFNVAFTQGLDELRHRAAEHGDDMLEADDSRATTF